MGPGGVVMLLVFGQDGAQVRLAQDQDPAQRMSKMISVPASSSTRNDSSPCPPNCVWRNCGSPPAGYAAQASHGSRVSYTMRLMRAS